MQVIFHTGIDSVFHDSALISITGWPSAGNQDVLPLSQALGMLGRAAEHLAYSGSDSEAVHLLRSLRCLIFEEYMTLKDRSRSIFISAA